MDGEARALQKCTAIGEDIIILTPFHSYILHLEGIVCAGSCNNSFSMDVGCKWTNDYQFDTALLLSVFLGMFGADR